MKGDVEGLPPSLQLPPALREERKGDPYEILRPALTDLVMIESMRILSAFEETIKRVDIITALSQISHDIKHFSMALGSNLVELVSRHSHVLGSLHDLQAQSEVIIRLTSLHLVNSDYDRYQMGPSKSVTWSATAFESVSTLSDDDENGPPVRQAPSELSWGLPEVDLVPSVIGDSGSSITQFKKQLKADAVRKQTPQTASDEIDMSASTIDLFKRRKSKEEDEGVKRTESGGIDDDVSMEYIQRVDNILERIESSQSGIAGAAGDSSAASRHSVGRSQALFSTLDVTLEGYSSIHLDEKRRASAIERSIKLVRDQLVVITKNLLRAFKQNPTAVEHVLAEKQRTEPTEELLRLLRKMREFLLYRLLTTPTEVVAREEYLKEVVKRAEAYEKLIDRLEQAVFETVEEKETKVCIRHRRFFSTSVYAHDATFRAS